MRPALSIIVPVYNASATLGGCIDSVLSQDYSDYELILVDDGSNDGSGAKCIEAANHNAKVKAIIKANGGVSTARNKGLDAATGDYIVFLDSDDTLLPGALSSLMNEQDADLVVGGLIHIVSTCPSGFENVPSKGIFSFKDVAAIDRLLCEVFMTAPWSKRFKRSIIEEHKIRFDNGLFYGEDTDFVYRYIVHIAEIVTVNRPITRYVDCKTALHRKYRLSFKDFRLLTNHINENVDRLEASAGSRLPVIRKFHIRHATNVYFDSLIHCQDYTTFRSEILDIRHNPSCLEMGTRKKKIIKWLALRNIMVTYFISRTYAIFIR